MAVDSVSALIAFQALVMTGRGNAAAALAGLGPRRRRGQALRAAPGPGPEGSAGRGQRPPLGGRSECTAQTGERWCHLAAESAQRRWRLRRQQCLGNAGLTVRHSQPRPEDGESLRANSPLLVPDGTAASPLLTAWAFVSSCASGLPLCSACAGLSEAVLAERGQSGS